jgi:amidase
MALRDELAGLDTLGQAALVRAGEVTALELVDAAIERIEVLNPVLNAVISTRYDAARAEAQAMAASDGSLPDSPLAGAPFLLKDLGAALAGTVQTEGSRAGIGRISPVDTELVIRQRAAGLIILGKTNTPEFGNHSTTEPESSGKTRNPWDTTRTTGGSSGGSAAAVASGMVPAAHGNDGAGSIRIPASCCGLVGLKPTRGRNSWAPTGDGMAGIAVEHALTLTVRDSAAILDATAGRVPGDPYNAPAPSRPFLTEVGADPGRLRIAWTATPPFAMGSVDPECVGAVRATAELLASLGHHVEDAAPKFDGEVIIEPLGRLWAISNLASVRSLERERGGPVRDDELEITTRELVEYAKRYSAVDLLDVLDTLDAASRDIAPFFERFDLWLTPSIAQLPLPLGMLNQSHGGAIEWWRSDCEFNPWNPIANITGQPAISLPLAWSRSGLPIGSLLTGRYGDEATLFRVAAQLEVAQPWAGRRPPVHALQPRA